MSPPLMLQYFYHQMKCIHPFIGHQIFHIKSFQDVLSTSDVEGGKTLEPTQNTKAFRFYHTLTGDTLNYAEIIKLVVLTI